MKFYVIYSADENAYWRGKNYQVQGEMFPTFEKELLRAKNWQSKKRAEAALDKMGARWVHDYGLCVEEHEIGVITSGQTTVKKEYFNGSEE